MVLTIAHRLLYVGRPCVAKNLACLPQCSHIGIMAASTACKVSLLDRDISLEYLNSLHHSLQKPSFSNELNPSLLVNLTKELHTNVYNSLNVYPWFQGGNYDVAYIQLLLNSSLKTLNLKIRDHPGYISLIERVNDNIDKFDPGQAANTAISFLAVGLPMYDTLVLKALKICEEGVHKTQITDLSTITALARMIGRNGLYLNSKIAQQADLIINETSPSCDFLDSLLNTYNSIQLFASDTLSEKFLDKFNQILEPDACLLRNGRTLGSVLRCIRRFPMNKSEEYYRFRNSVSDLILHSIRNELDFSQLSHSQVGELCHHLQCSRLYHRDVAERFQKRALDIIRDSNRICDISNALYAFNTKWTNLLSDDRRTIESKVLKHMMDADVLILSNLAETLKNINCRNSDIISNFQQLILIHAETLFTYISRLEKIIRHLLWCNFKSRQQEEKFMNILLNKLSGTQLGQATWCLATVACYLLKNTGYKIQSVLYEKLLRIIPQCKVRDLYPILVAMNSAHKSIHASSAHDLDRLLTTIYANVAERVDTIDSLDLLSQFISELLNKSPCPDTNILQRLMNIYPKLALGMTKPQFNKIAMNHAQLKYYNPRVFEDLSDFLVKKASENDKELNAHDMVKFMSMLNAVGYTPKRIGELKDVLLNFYDTCSSEMDVDEILNYVEMLASMQIFPEDVLCDIFNMEFIHRVDKFLEANPEKRQQVEFTMMKLNRIVAIECPELDVPWFFDNYCQEHIVSDYKRENLTFSNMVDHYMTQLFGCDRYHKTWVYSPYYYRISFEVLLDENGQAIDITTAGNKLPTVGQRVAICCLVASNFCYNKDDELNGYEKIRRRHLEMLGYKVVEISHCEWNSMGMAGDNAKISDLRQKIFG